MERARDFVIGLLIFIICESILLQGCQSLEYFHRDEANWVRVSIYSFRTFFLEQDYSDQGWSKPFRTFGSYNPQVGKFIIGASLWIHGFRDFDGVIRWNRDKNLKWHIEQGIVPSLEELCAARLPIAILTAGTALLVLVLATFAQRVLLCGNELLGGILSALFFISHPLIQGWGRRASPDMPATFFSTLAVTLAVMSGLSLMGKLCKRSLMLGLAASVVIGLAISTKMNALLIWPVGFLSLSWVVPRKFESHSHRDNGLTKTVLANLVFVIGLPPAIFVLTNPFLYHNTLSGIRHMMGLSAVVRSYRADYPGHALFTIPEKIRAFAGLGFGPLENLVQIQNIDIPIAGIGIIIMIYILLRRRPNREGVFIASMLLSWTVIIGMGVALWSPLAWDRYYIPLTPIVSVWEGIGLAWLLTAVLRYSRTFIGRRVSF